MTGRPPLTEPAPVRLLAFYLPQFHPIPENDRWWGPGFTEWTNVVKARPLFAGHAQPHLPADLGFYDLRVPEVREAQADLARAHGISGFCYYHYWFDGRRLLSRPFDEVLESGRPDFPFCLCWANENWTRRWDGRDQEILMEQGYSPDDDLAHIRYLATAFADPRYVRIGDRPLFLIYHPDRLPDPRRMTDRWRAEAVRLGVGEPYLCRVESSVSRRIDPALDGFDAAVEFQPDWRTFGRRHRLPNVHRLRRKLSKDWESPYIRHRILGYPDLVQVALSQSRPHYQRFRCVTPSWDNTPRRRVDAIIVRGSTPDLYRIWLQGVVNEVSTAPSDQRVVFVNAWNEWAEGNHLEPDRRWGHGYLGAHRTVLDQRDASQGAAPWRELMPQAAPLSDIVDGQS
jgi:lipopolysaccharide biosynthesis protein